MLDDKTYRIWTEAFSPVPILKVIGKKEIKFFFLVLGKRGMGGMVSRIKENKLYQFISIEHLGEVKNGIEDTTSEAIKKWAGALENYTFNEKNSTTELLIEMDSIEEYEEMFKDMWPKALQKLKEIAES
jgi:hypothetical protein